ncbi:MAG: RNA-binding protein [Bauldia sp.]
MNEASERTCIVTRQALPVDALIRFALAPDGSVVPDLRRRLPGRGAWVTASAVHVRLAERKRLFARAFGGPAIVEPGLVERLDALLVSAATGALSLARKAGSLVVGFAKVERALAGDPVVALIHALDAAPDGLDKLAAAARRRFGEGSPPVVACFTGEQLDLALGRTNVIHAALLAGPASDYVLARVRDLVRYRGDGDPDGGGGRPTNALNQPNQASAGL